jgi:hypothetical protein
MFPIWFTCLYKIPLVNQFYILIDTVNDIFFGIESRGRTTIGTLVVIEVLEVDHPSVAEEQGE